MSCSPKARSDFEGIPLMVGLRHATYSAAAGYVAFGNFRLETIIRYKAHDPAPADKAGNVVVSKLAWKRGDYAAQHDVYFGTSLADVNDATPSTAEIYKGRQDPNSYPISGLEPGTTYYWRIDEVNDAHPDKLWKGDVWSFKPVPLIAWNPGPKDGAECVASNKKLTWSAGSTALKHEVYFGADQAAVATATRTNPQSVYKVSQTGTTYDPGNLAKSTTYFWRVDEVEKNGSTRYKGTVWSFKTLADIAVFDSHLVGWWKLDGGCANNDIAVDSSGYSRHGTVKGNGTWIPGYDGSALDFDGRGTYVELPIGDLIATLTDSTFATWANFSNSAAPGSGSSISATTRTSTCSSRLAYSISTRCDLRSPRAAAARYGADSGMHGQRHTTEWVALRGRDYQSTALTVVLYIDGRKRYAIRPTCCPRIWARPPTTGLAGRNMH